MPKNKAEVNIYGTSYTIVGAESEEYIRKVAAYIDKKIKEVSRSKNMLNKSMTVTLAAVNIVDELFKNIDETKQLKVQLDHLSKDIQRQKDEAKKKENDLLGEINRLKDECKNLKVRHQAAEQLAEKSAQREKNLINQMEQKKAEYEKRIEKILEENRIMKVQTEELNFQVKELNSKITALKENEEILKQDKTANENNLLREIERMKSQALQRESELLGQIDKLKKEYTEMEEMMYEEYERLRKEKN